MMQLFIVTVLCFEETVVYTIAVYASSIRWHELSLPLMHLLLLDCLKLSPCCLVLKVGTHQQTAKHGHCKVDQFEQAFIAGQKMLYSLTRVVKQNLFLMV